MGTDDPFASHRHIRSASKPRTNNWAERSQTRARGERTRRVPRLAAAAAATAALAVTMLGPSASASARTYVTGVGGSDRPAHKPQAFIAGSGVGCGVFRLKQLRWTTWTARTARATGMVLFNTGRPCSAGKYESFRARIRLHRPRRGCRIYRNGRMTRTSKRLFTRIDVFTSASRRTFRSTTTVGTPGYCRARRKPPKRGHEPEPWTGEFRWCFNAPPYADSLNVDRLSCARGKRLAREWRARRPPLGRDTRILGFICHPARSPGGEWTIDCRRGRQRAAWKI